MIFTPNEEEQKILNEIQKIYSINESTVIRVTRTMVEKSIIDDGPYLPGIIKSAFGKDLTALEPGTEKWKLPLLFILNGSCRTLGLSFYRAKTRGDRRFSIENIKGQVADGVLKPGDLIYFSVKNGKDGEKNTFFAVNLTSGSPSPAYLRKVLGLDPIQEALQKLLPKAREVVDAGWIPNSKGSGPVAPKDCGDTLESLLGIETNNRSNADYNGLIELKTKTSKGTRDTLFTLKPSFEGTPVAEAEPKDRSRVHAFERMYGYESDKHPGMASLYVTIGPKSAPQNNQGLFLAVDEKALRVNLMAKREGSKAHVAAFWTFDSLSKELKEKHPSTLWFVAKSRKTGDTAEFNYTDIEFTRTPIFSAFLQMVESGEITYDWRGYTTWKGKYSGKNHGNAWRIKDEYRCLLFGTISIVVGGKKAS
ncbi:MAG: MvaI/BcnI family restriction endonuclease [Sutterellaceae bacterium]|nr:MvaI/BcnI family restriction endonuclease [Sutterellaceae bacterium]MDD7442639.1 MvaI/BcnI family restriction endonuclease [Sutterellaceae bacterium]MDY2868329.1 MvaI/BcnI family restriction endonuclease [Mesosutterella sp.]